MSNNTIKADQISHVWLHLFLIFFTIIAIYPVLWVVTVAFSIDAVYFRPPSSRENWGKGRQVR